MEGDDWCRVHQCQMTSTSCLKAGSNTGSGVRGIAKIEILKVRVIGATKG